MNLEKLTIGDKIWVMVNNKPRELLVSKIVSTFEAIANDKPRQTTIALASYSENYNHDHKIIESESFDTPQELQQWLFNFDK